MTPSSGAMLTVWLVSDDPPCDELIRAAEGHAAECVAKWGGNGIVGW
jgi:hypothetical protein